MAGRWAHLAVKAHISNALNFKDASRYERNWLLAERLVFEAIEDELAAKMNSMVHQWHCSASAAAGWDESGDDFEFHRKEAEKAYKEVGKLALPWYNSWSPPKSVEELWLDFKRQEKDPKFQEWRKSVKKKMQEETRKQKEGAERLKKAMTLLKEQNEKRKKNRKKKRA